MNKIDLSLLISTIQNQGLVNFEDDRLDLKINEEIDKNEQEIKKF